MEYFQLILSERNTKLLNYTWKEIYEIKNLELAPESLK